MFDLEAPNNSTISNGASPSPSRCCTLTRRTGSSNAAAIADAGIRKAIQILDDNDVPMEGRSLVVPPVARNSMLGIARFTEQAFKGNGTTLINGEFGDGGSDRSLACLPVAQRNDISRGRWCLGLRDFAVAAAHNIFF
jgi:hypothetical protein